MDRIELPVSPVVGVELQGDQAIGETGLIRELVEETGLRAKTWKKLASFYPSPGYVEELMTIFLATDLTQGDARPMEDERIETRWFKKKEVRDRLRSNEIIDAKTMIGFLYWDCL